ncbi:MAG: hypothetical protein JSV03_06050, partial [Planctomycetota bacterium]
SRSAIPGLARGVRFQLINGVAIYGGFAGTEENLKERNPDPATNGTVLSGDLNGDDLLGVGGSHATRGDNCFHVVEGSGTDSVAILDGFTITGGRADGSRQYDCGGGLYNYQGSPTITNCIFKNNSAKRCGGAIHNDYHSNPTLINCAFVGNAADEGGALHNFMNSNPILTNCMFAGNSAIQDGGAMCNRSCKPIMINCTFGGNSANGTGGGIYNVDSNPSLSNCILWGNRDGGDVVTTAQIHNQGGMPVFKYCCIEDDVPGDGNVPAGEGNIDTDPLFVRDPDDGGDGWHSGDNDDFGNLHLKTGSPCIDAANTALVSQDVIDLDNDGNRFEPVPLDLDLYPRFVDEPTTPDTGKDYPPIVDIGAYEYQPDCNRNGISDACDIDCSSHDGRCDVPGCGSSGDCNHNGIPDECEPDSDNDSVPDVCEFIYGDFDLDGDVDQEDFGQLQACYSGSGETAEGGCEKADLNFDSTVDISDYKMFRNCMTGANMPADPHCIN